MDTLAEGDRLIPIGEVLRLTGLTEGQFRLLLKHDGFPEPVQLTPRARVWPLSVVREWIRQKIVESSQARDG
jgi:predicted DNA-binding transcriptional regulator AlpA